MSFTRFYGFAVAGLCLVYLAATASAELVCSVEVPRDDMALRTLLTGGPSTRHQERSASG